MAPERGFARLAIRRVHGWRQDYHFERTYLAFLSWLLFWSRSDRWCAIEPRGEGLGGGVRSQGGAQGARRGEQYLERSGRRTPPPYNRPRSHRAATATFGRIGPSTFKRLARFLVTRLFRVAGLWLRLGCCDRSGAFPERGARGRRK